MLERRIDESTLTHTQGGPLSFGFQRRLQLLKDLEADLDLESSPNDRRLYQALSEGSEIHPVNESGQRKFIIGDTKYVYHKNNVTQKINDYLASVKSHHTYLQTGFKDIVNTYQKYIQGTKKLPSQWELFFSTHDDYYRGPYEVKEFSTFRKVIHRLALANESTIHILKKFFDKDLDLNQTGNKHALIDLFNRIFEDVQRAYLKELHGYKLQRLNEIEKLAPEARDYELFLLQIELTEMEGKFARETDLLQEDIRRLAEEMDVYHRIKKTKPADRKDNREALQRKWNNKNYGALKNHQYQSWYQIVPRENSKYLTSAKKQKNRAWESTFKTIAGWAASLLAFGEGAVPAASVFALLYPLVLLTGPFATFLFIGLVILSAFVFANASYCNYFLVKADTYDTLCNFYYQRLFKDEAGNNIHFVKGLLIGFYSLSSIGAGSAYAVISYFAVKLVIFSFLGLFGLASVLSIVPIISALLVASATFLTLKCLYFLADFIFIKDMGLAQTKAFFKKHFGVPIKDWKDGVRIFLKGLAFTAGLVVAAAILYIQFYVFRMKLLNAFGWNIHNLSNLAYRAKHAASFVWAKGISLALDIMNFFAQAPFAVKKMVNLFLTLFSFFSPEKSSTATPSLSDKAPLNPVQAHADEQNGRGKFCSVFSSFWNGIGQGIMYGLGMVSNGFSRFMAFLGVCFETPYSFGPNAEAGIAATNKKMQTYLILEAELKPKASGSDLATPMQNGNGSHAEEKPEDSYVLAVCQAAEAMIQYHNEAQYKQCLFFTEPAAQPAAQEPRQPRPAETKCAAA